MPKKEKKKRKSKYDKPFSLYPLNPDQALEIFMSIPLEKVKEIK